MAREVGPGTEDEIWVDITEVPTTATGAALRAYVDRNLVREKWWWAYLRWLRDLQKIEHEKALHADLHHIKYKKACCVAPTPGT
jgi:hypothetical protein